jgi:hypothetical protein
MPKVILVVLLLQWFSLPIYIPRSWGLCSSGHKESKFDQITKFKPPSSPQVRMTTTRVIWFKVTDDDDIRRVNRPSILLAGSIVFHADRLGRPNTLCTGVYPPSGHEDVEQCGPDDAVTNNGLFIEEFDRMGDQRAAQRWSR